MFPPNMDLADGRQESARDRWVQQQMEEALRHLPADMEVLPSPLLLKQMEREAVQRPSPPSSLVARPDPTAKQASFSRHRKGRRGAFPCLSAGEEESPMAAAVTSAVVCLPADVKVAASIPVSSSATAPSPRLAAAPPMPSSLAPVRGSVAMPEELEEHLRFYARHIKSFRRASLIYSSPELTAKSSPHQVFRALLQSSPRQVSRALLLQSSPRQVFRALLQLSRRQGSRALPLCRPSLPQPPPHAAEVIGGPGDASAQVIWGPSDTSAPAHATEGRGDASAPAHTTEGRGDTSAPAQATEGLGNASALAHATEGLGYASASAPGLKAFQGFSERLVLILVPEPCDEGFEDETPPEPVWLKSSGVLGLGQGLRHQNQKLVPPYPVLLAGRVEEVGLWERGCSYSDSGIIGSLLLPPFPQLLEVS
ncbi:hypothetical protein CRENBAI_018005 [Crenichthys baileyi]|uniref:Uncharacterized protein n=1 Tax=Crenichthys baileyi TaxID=28760 RepID=A0AAV9SNZ7_9TELE